jgi:hypothetical protein
LLNGTVRASELETFRSDFLRFAISALVFAREEANPKPWISTSALNKK